MAAEDSTTAVVVADNHETVLKAISATLGKAGFTILAATTGAQALQYCRDSSSPVRLAIIDVSTAGIDAADLERQLDEVSPEMRTLFLANRAQENSLREVAQSGHVRGFLRKPFRRAQLLGQVLQMMDRSLVLTA